MAAVVLGFVPARRWQRRVQLRRLRRRWADHHIDRAAVGARWRPPLDTLTALDRQLRALGLVEPAAQTATALDEALTRAVTGTRVDAEISRAAALGESTNGTGLSPATGDPDVAAVHADLTYARTTANGLLKANTDAAHHFIKVAAAATAERGRTTAAVEAVRVRALGTLAQATTDAAVLLPDQDPDPATGEHPTGS